MLFTEAQKVLVGGVNSPIRAFKSVGGVPLFMKRGQGAYLYTEDGQELIDYVLSYGPLILGHAHPKVLAKIQETMVNGTAFGAPNRLEIELAQLVQQFFPSIEKIRFVNSGTESTMSAARLARGFTKRDVIVKFRQCYHGHGDSLLNCPDQIDFNDFAALDALFKQKGGKIAAVIVEPVCGNVGVVLPEPGFLSALRAYCTTHGALLIFDEVMTGFRVSLGGAQELYSITPDLTCLGKVIGGGLPCGAFGGRADVMDYLAPLGPVYQGGTMSGNPVAMAAGIATLTELQQPQIFSKICEMTTKLVTGIQTQIGDKVVSIGTMFTVFLDSKEEFSRYYHAMLQRGVYFAPSQHEANFLSSAHGDEEIEKTLAAFKEVL